MDSYISYNVDFTRSDYIINTLFFAEMSPSWIIQVYLEYALYLICCITGSKNKTPLANFRYYLNDSQNKILYIHIYGVSDLLIIEKSYMSFRVYQEETYV